MITLKLHRTMMSFKRGWWFACVFWTWIIVCNRMRLFVHCWRFICAVYIQKQLYLFYAIDKNSILGICFKISLGQRMTLNTIRERSRIFSWSNRIAVKNNLQKMRKFGTFSVYKDRSNGLLWYWYWKYPVF